MPTDFEFDIGDRVVIKQSSKQGEVLGLHVDRDQVHGFHVRYVDDNGNLQWDWLRAAELTLVS